MDNFPDLFISYHRAGGGELAMLISLMLKERGYTVFLDHHSIGKGNFKEQIFRQLEHTSDLVLVLTSGALDGCCEPENWMRMEIAQAFKNGANVVPVIKEGFHWPLRMPDDILRVKYLQGIEFRTDYAEASIDRLCELLNARPGNQASKTQSEAQPAPHPDPVQETIPPSQPKPMIQSETIPKPRPKPAPAPQAQAMPKPGPMPTRSNPARETMFGYLMPTPRWTLEAEPDASVSIRDELHERFLGFYDDDYRAFSAYLGACGAVAEPLPPEGTLFAVTLKLGVHRMIFGYERREHWAKLIYSQGTRPETEPMAESGRVSCLPPVYSAFRLLPNAASVLNRDTRAVRRSSDGKREALFEGVSEQDLVSIIQYFDLRGWKLKNKSLRLSALVSECVNENRSVTLNYTLKERRLVIEYPPDGDIEAEAVAAKRGDILRFGRYPQGKDGKLLAIKWEILDERDGSALLLSKCALAVKPFHEAYTDVTWESCALRKWLNGEFLSTAFSAAEKSRILLSNVTADRNPNHGTDPGNDTRDCVFLLSCEEALNYFADDAARKCMPTQHAAANTSALFSRSLGRDGACWWWLRSPGSSRSLAASVRNDGCIRGDIVHSGGNAVRPAIWIRLK